MYKSIMNNRKGTFVIVIFSFVLMLASCKPQKQLGYNIVGLSDSLKVSLPDLKAPATVIQPDDILEIRFTGSNQQTVIDFNTKGSSYGATTGGSNYLVDQEGNVEIYLLGKIKAAGLTKDQLKEKLVTDVSRYLKEANANIRFTNFRFTVLGEVKSPGNFVIPNEKISILEAIALTGDMTQFSKRSIVRVIRDSSGNREIGTINFNERTLFTSPYYYLRRNDIIIVERDNKVQQTQVLSTVSSLIGIVTSIITLFFVIKTK